MNSIEILLKSQTYIRNKSIPYSNKLITYYRGVEGFGILGVGILKWVLGL